MSKSQIEIKSGEALSGAKKALQETAQLQEQLNHLHLAVASLWDLVKERLHLSDEDLRGILETKKAEARNQEDKVTPCPQCGRPVSERRKLCLYCGNKIPGGPPF